MAAGFLLSALLTMRHVPGVPAAAGLTMAVAIFVLARPQSVLLPALAAGVLSGVIMSMLRAEGVPLLAAAAAGLSFPAMSAWLSRRQSSFAPETLRGEAALLVLVLAAIVAAAPTVANGWQAAVSLNILDPAARRMAVPNWTVGLAGLALAVSGLFRWWRRA